MTERIETARRSWARHRAIGMVDPAVMWSAVTWSVTYVVLTLSGHRYGMWVVYGGWQYPPAEAMLAAPVRASWDLHIQPPAWSLVVGSLGAWSPLDWEWSLRLLSLLMGTALAGFIALTLRRVGAGIGLAIGLTAFATLNSQVLQHAFEPRYELPTMLLLAALVCWVAGPTRRSATWPLLAPILLLTTLAMVRALYHPVFIMVTIALVLWWRREVWRSPSDRSPRYRLIIVLLVPIAVVGGWSVKNAAMFGSPSLSSWSGMNLLRSVQPAIDADDLADLRAAGVVSDVALAGPFEPYEAYANEVGPCRERSGDSATLTLAARSIPPDAPHPFGWVTEVPNWNARCFLAVYDRAGDDARALIAARPGKWLEARLWAANGWFEILQVSDDQGLAWRAVEGGSRIALLQMPHPGLPDRWGDTWYVRAAPFSLMVILTSAMVLGTAVRDLRRQRTRRDAGDPRSDDERAERCDGPLPDGQSGADVEQARRLSEAVVLTAWILVWTFAVGVGAELGEQSRFRETIDPVVLSLGGFLLIRSISRVRAWRRWQTVISVRRETLPTG